MAKQSPLVEMDSEELAIKAQHRRRNPTQFNVEWKCEYCGKVLSNETYFLKHTCKQKTRAEEINSPLGKSAYFFYCDWMKAYKRKPPNIETFTTSRYYASFVAFAKHVQKLKLADPNSFVQMMCLKDISPMLWRRDQCYSMYLEWLDRNTNPLDQVKQSIECLIDLSTEMNVELSEIFNVVGITKITELIRERKLSPWFLFCSKKFSVFLKSISKDETIELSAVINPSHWAEKLQNDKKLVKDIMEINQEIGL